MGGGGWGDGGSEDEDRRAERENKVANPKVVWWGWSWVREDRDGGDAEGGLERKMLRKRSVGKAKNVELRRMRSAAYGGEDWSPQRS